MAKTLLNGVNEVLKRVRVISGDNGALTTLTDSVRQGYIDVAVQAWNEAIDELYSTTGEARPTQQSSSTVTLVASTRAYVLASDLVRLRWPLIDQTNSQIMWEFPGGYNELLKLDLEQDDTGLPHYAAIRPTDGYLHMDRAPTSAEAGRVYTYQYDKSIGLSAYTDTMPFNDAVFRGMVPAVVQLWKREERNEFDGDLFKANIGRASRLVTEVTARTHYSPRC